MTTFTVRDASAADMPALAKVYRRASLSNEGDVDALLANPGVLVLSEEAVLEGRTRVALSPDGSIVGFASARLSGRVFELDDLFVDPDWMRNGVARQLVGDIAGAASRQGISRVTVTANPHALPFYNSVGFRGIGDVETRFGSAPRMVLYIPVAIDDDSSV